MNILDIAITKVHPAKYNPRKDLVPGDPAYDKLKKALDRFDLVEPLVWNKRTGNLVGGHQRFKIIKERGDKKVTVSVVDLDELSEKALNLALNKHAGEWEFASLAEIMKELTAADLDIDVTGFDAAELEKMMGLSAPPAEEDAEEDDVPEPPNDPVTKPGDLWLLGGHRILCGDSRNADDVLRLMDGAKANLVMMSPPYASQRAYDPTSAFRPVPPTEYVEWFMPVAAHIRSILAVDGSYFLNIKEHAENGQRDLYVKDLVIAHRRLWEWMFIDEFCWRNTANGVPGYWPNRFKNAWEPVFQFALTPQIKFRPMAVSHPSDSVVVYAPTNTSAPSGSGLLGVGADKVAGMALPSNVIEIKAEGGQSAHSAPFPSGLPAFFIKAFTDTGDRTFDPFMGSGSTLIATERLERIGYGMQISPAYCDVIVERWQNLTGKKAELA